MHEMNREMQWKFFVENFLCLFGTKHAIQIAEQVDQTKRNKVGHKVTIQSIFSTDKRHKPLCFQCYQSKKMK